MSGKMPIGELMSEVRAAQARGDGYIMGATGQNPQKWDKNSWWFTQYSGKQRTQALYWRSHAQRVWDCNGLAEGIYKDWCGTDINTRARYNYSAWCTTRGKGMIPAERRVPGAVVFWGSQASDIHHVAYLDAPVEADKPDGDWYLIEARGVMYGVVRTKLYARKPDFWGLMEKYFDYAVSSAPRVRIVGGDCWIREQPNTSAKKIGVAKAGSILSYGGETAENGWLRVENGWVSGKYGRLEE